MKNLCLAQFATSYTYVRADKIPKGIEWLDNASEITGNLKLFGGDDFLPKYISLDSGTYMALRTKPLVLRIHSSKKKEYLEGIYSELLLYLPWRTEKELKKGSNDDCVKLFNDNKDIIDRNRKAKHLFEEELTLIKHGVGRHLRIFLELSHDNTYPLMKRKEQ